MTELLRPLRSPSEPPRMPLKNDAQGFLSSEDSTTEVVTVPMDSRTASGNGNTDEFDAEMRQYGFDNNTKPKAEVRDLADLNDSQFQRAVDQIAGSTRNRIMAFGDRIMQALTRERGWGADQRTMRDSASWRIPALGMLAALAMGIVDGGRAQEREMVQTAFPDSSVESFDELFAPVPEVTNQNNFVDAISVVETNPAVMDQEASELEFPPVRVVAEVPTVNTAQEVEYEASGEMGEDVPELARAIAADLDYARVEGALATQQRQAREDRISQTRAVVEKAQAEFPDRYAQAFAESLSPQRAIEKDAAIKAAAEAKAADQARRRAELSAATQRLRDAMSSTAPETVKTMQQGQEQLTLDEQPTQVVTMTPQERSAAVKAQLAALQQKRAERAQVQKLVDDMGDAMNQAGMN